MFKIGCGEKKLEIPQFAELYGYGMFAGRRNTHTLGDLYCRAFSFNDGEKRAMIIYTDICTTDDIYAREMRIRIATEYSIHPDYITFTATHTHSAPALFYKGFCGSGIPDPGFQQHWKDTVMEVAKQAFYNEEEIAYAEAGKCLLSQKLGTNRIAPEKDSTDGTIRWARFIRPDGSCKVLLHSHGVHGIVMNGPFYKIASSDWGGAANQLIQDEKLADIPLFLLGPCGDINAKYTARDIPEEKNPHFYTAKLYIADLKKGIASGGEKLTDLTIRSAMETVRVPVKKQTVEELAKDAADFRAINEYEAERANRIDEMIARIKKGDDLTVLHDFQALRIGKLSFLFIPGEYFVEEGAKLMSRSAADYPFAVTVANGNGMYFPSEKIMKEYPDPNSKKPGGGFGFYEVHCYPVRHRYRYADNISDFVADKLIELEQKAK